MGKGMHKERKVPCNEAINYFIIKLVGNSVISLQEKVPSYFLQVFDII